LQPLDLNFSGTEPANAPVLIRDELMAAQVTGGGDWNADAHGYSSRRSKQGQDFPSVAYMSIFTPIDSDSRP
jgi:hypothetical protein